MTMIASLSLEDCEIYSVYQFTCLESTSVILLCWDRRRIDKVAVLSFPTDILGVPSR
jgi:hypothetical protein